MIIVTRKLGEAVFIGSDIKVTLLQVQGRFARLGFDAPHELGVNREEVYTCLREKIMEDNLRFAK